MNNNNNIGFVYSAVTTFSYFSFLAGTATSAKAKIPSGPQTTHRDRKKPKE